MKKKFNHYISLSLLLLSVLPFSLVSAETVEEVPTGETTISSMADDPLKELKEKAANQVPTIESTPESESVEDTPTNESETKEDVPKTEDTTETKPKPQARGGGIGPQAVNLIEGVDIDAGFAQVLRTDAMAQNLGTSWSGYGKAVNQLTDDDMAALTRINVPYLNLSSLEGIEYAVNLMVLECGNNDLTSLDVSNSTNLVDLRCSYNQINNLNLGAITSIRTLDVSANPIGNLDISNFPDLSDLNCQGNQLTSLDISNNLKLRRLTCGFNNLTSLDINTLLDLEQLHCDQSGLTDLDVSSNVNLTYISCNSNFINALDFSSNTKLKTLSCGSNQLTNLDISANLALQHLSLDGNFLNKIDVSSNLNLEYLNVNYNRISDITSAFGLPQLSQLKCEYQMLTTEVPAIIGGQTTIDLLKTAAGAGLSVSNVDITGAPILTPNGDKIELSNVTALDLDEKSLSFDYNGSQLTEGSSFGTKSFSGTITFRSISDLSNQLIPDKKKVKSGEEVQWTWEIESINPKKALNIYAELSLPSGLTLVPGSIEVDGVPASLNDINGTNNLGDLDTGESMKITFKTKAVGTAEEWLEPIGKLKWEDLSPRDNQSKGGVRIKDDEQTYTPKDSDDMAIQSVPVYFNHGTNPIMTTAQTYHLHAMNYQSNIKVVTDGFYTRIKDDRAISTGWKLTAKLSDFKDSSNQPMPNGTGTMLKLENMSIERMTDRDTPQEVIDPTPSGLDVPSVQATETLVAGQSTAKTIVSAQPNEGQDTWQLRMPFDKVSLSIPANAGKKGTVYKANLTWSLDDTP
ncbi:WxL domain-containing protein [Enterococcus gilvus]|uniref:WxL domain-containing protein n=1 Tax=Enterococcus gilvus TaxID=160453 RepID=UPI001C8C9F36|nr:WxL domain-containing protein [Enterococcus gilvus]MBX8935314.1 hypothetical protein [Enterococcus gilvus]